MNYKGENYYIYIISPIDCFENSMSIEHYAREEIKNYFECGFLSVFGGLSDNRIINKYEKAKLDIKNTSEKRGYVWELDFRCNPVMFSVPCEGMFDVGFVIKQDNNGTTFVASPVPLPHLECLDWSMGV